MLVLQCNLNIRRELKRQQNRIIKEKQEAKKEKERETETKKEVAQTPTKKHNPAEVHKGTIIRLPPPKEKASMCLVRDAFLPFEPCNMAGVHPGQVDFMYDSGTVSGYG